MSWENNFSIGSQIEDFIQEYFEEVFGWKFIAGTQGKNVVGIEKIEKLFDCEYLHPQHGLHGPQLRFSDGTVLTMPDILMSSKNDIIFWAESKCLTNKDYTSIDIEESKLREYYSVYQRTNKNVYVIVTRIDGDYCEIYSCRIKELLKPENSEQIYNRVWRKDVRRFDISSRMFNSLTNGWIKWR